MKLFRLLAADLRAKALWCYDSSGWKAVLKVLLTDGTAAMFLYRLMQWARRWHLAPLEMVFNNVISAIRYTSNSLGIDAANARATADFSNFAQDANRPRRDYGCRQCN